VEKFTELNNDVLSHCTSMFYPVSDERRKCDQ
jgi:hypothetical protein